MLPGIAAQAAAATTIAFIGFIAVLGGGFVLDLAARLRALEYEAHQMRSLAALNSHRQLTTSSNSVSATLRLTGAAPAIWLGDACELRLDQSPNQEPSITSSCNFSSNATAFLLERNVMLEAEIATLRMQNNQLVRLMATDVGQVLIEGFEGSDVLVHVQYESANSELGTSGCYSGSQW